uniref:Large ribosomal subunit protein uL29c n=1 Tax=Alsidium seaforthii TaxID=2007182 RepID=A0A1Z1MD33_9FLOR|nr:ribosomal protein L29 [Bryothamnion seaforthii]ARW63988.1 ribosomal protein L29 [Bryothamnion seaforthii]
MTNKQKESIQADLDQNIIKLKKELVFLRIKKVTKQKTKPHLIRKTKNRISQIRTIKTINKLQ